MPESMWLWYLSFLVCLGVAFYSWRAWRQYHDSPTNEIDERAREKGAFMRDVERGYYGDIEQPAFLRETAAARRSRYIGRRPGTVTDTRNWQMISTNVAPEDAACINCEAPIARADGRVARQQGASWAHVRCVG